MRRTLPSCIRELFVRDRRTKLREDFVARFATSTLIDARGSLALDGARARASAKLLSGLLLLSRP
ncbi:MAG: hypothetical protein KDJ44_09265 [Rhodoblastus sp.]|nr:hypothetical protein [Rhodoblastus sp.]